MSTATPLVKICGVTSPEDAEWLVADGRVAFLGLNCWRGSRRCIRAELGRAICEAVAGRATVVGVFVDQSEEDVRRVLDLCPLDWLQLHGDESADFGRRFGRPWMKAVRLKDDTSLDAIPDYVIDAAQPLLVDAWSSVAPGGTGTVVHLDLAARARALAPRLFLAGGLTAENVGWAIERVKPYAVDVASGVEVTDVPGRKDPRRVRAFLDAVEAAR